MSSLRPSRLLWPLVPIYAAASGLRGLAYDRGWVRPRCLRAPVVSVGNLSTGGSGKTPLVMCLAGLLTDHGWAVDVLTRGYGRNGQTVERVDPDSGDAVRYGDEPLLLAQARDIPIYVGSSRQAAGLLAEDNAAIDWHVHLLDDGFQHRQLARSVDLVLLHPTDLDEWLLPAGRLREPLSALNRAQVIVLRTDDTDSEAVLRRRGLILPVWRVTRELALPSALMQGHLSSPPAARPLAFCGIARPQEFFAGLVEAGAPPIITLSFADHHTYTVQDIKTLADAARMHAATHLLTTEKDWVRLSALARASLEQIAPVLPVPLRTRLLDEQRCLEQLTVWIKPDAS